jgi:plastocyanin
VQVGWTPVPGATLYQYFVAVTGQSAATAIGVTTGLLVQVPLAAQAGGLATSYSAIARACPAGTTCSASSETGWGPWSNVAGPGGNTFTVVPATGTIVITILGMNGANSYAPASLTVSAGRSVAWRNVDSQAHTATADGGAFDTAAISPLATSGPVTLPTGSYPYHCSFHPTMVGTVNVTP